MSQKIEVNGLGEWTLTITEAPQECLLSVLIDAKSVRMVLDVFTETNEVRDFSEHDRNDLIERFQKAEIAVKSIEIDELHLFSEYSVKVISKDASIVLDDFCNRGLILEAVGDYYYSEWNEEEQSHHISLPQYLRGFWSTGLENPSHQAGSPRYLLAVLAHILSDLGVQNLTVFER